MKFIIGILVVLVIIALVFLPTNKCKGIIGELRVKLVIGKTKENKRYVINNYVINDNGQTRQIDHILINEKGIFIIETKNYAGRIYGDENQQKWTQVLKYGKVKNSFYNPIKQNNSHTYAIGKALSDKYKDKIIPVVVFTKAELMDLPKGKVVKLNRLKRFINDHSISLTLDEIKECYDALESSRTLISNKEHVESINKMLNKIDDNICPRCSSPLAERNGKYGPFFGCSNYPKCKFIKK